MADLGCSSGLTASVVIAAHDAEVTIGEQLAALASQRQAPPFDVVLVLNRCRDGTRTIAETFLDRLRLSLVEADLVAGIAYARNVGWRAATADIVLYCDADDRVGPGWVAGMVAPFVAGDADLVGGRVVVDRSELVGRRAWFYDAKYAWMDGSCLHQKDPAWPLCATLGIRRDVLSAVGGFDEGLAFAGEEVWLARQVDAAGYRIGAAPDAEILYRPRTTLGGLLRQHARQARGSAVMAVRDGRRPRRPLSRRISPWLRAFGKAAKAVRRGRERDPRRLLLKFVWDVNFLDELRVRSITSGTSAEGAASSRT